LGNAGQNQPVNGVLCVLYRVVRSEVDFKNSVSCKNIFEKKRENKNYTAILKKSPAV
jgi:hypothetical protein